MTTIRHWAINSPSQLENGEYYRLVGEDSAGLPIPPQVFRLHSWGYGGFYGMGCMIGTLWVRACGVTIRFEHQEIPFIDVNIRPFPDSSMGEHGFHGRHLERFPAGATGQMAIARYLPDSYHEVQEEQQAKHPIDRPTWRKLWGSLG